MRKIIVILLLSCVCLNMRAQELDSLTRAKLSDKLEEYFVTIDKLDTEAQKAETDFIIEVSTDSLVRQFVAVKSYSHFLNSPRMGSEAVAIHVLDKWFLDGKIKMYDEMDLLNARIFADFNRQSLVGEKAPELTLFTPENEMVNLYAVPSERYSILYIYDTDCAKCKLEGMRLNKVLSDKSSPVDFYAFYAGDNKDKWDQYREENFKFNEITVRHFWDPEIDSDFQRKYGVLQTPRMFLISPDGTIIGRGLDCEALIQMLDAIFADTDLEYGSDESAELFGKLLGPSPTRREIADVAKMLEDATLGSGNQVMFKQLIGDYLYYLAPKTGQEYKEGLYGFIVRYILDRDDIWTSEDDKLKVVGFAEIMHDLLSKAVPGTRIADIKVQGTLLAMGKEKVARKNLSKLRGQMNIIIFHTEGCHICEAEIKAARTLASSNPKSRVFLVNVDKLVEENPAMSASLFDSFDLSALPYILQTDKKGNIIRRYMSIQ